MERLKDLIKNKYLKAKFISEAQYNLPLKLDTKSYKQDKKKAEAKRQ